MPDAEEIRRLYAYNRAVLERYIRALERLPWAVVSKNRETGHRTMKDTMVHILIVHDAWVNYVAKGRVKELKAARNRFERPRSMREVKAFMAQVWYGVDSLLAAIDDKALRKRVKAPWMPGKYTLADAFMQASIEQAHHLGEIIAVMWQMDKEPPAMTWIENLRK